MSTRKILILQGGGALGAYECGVYQELAPGLDDLAVVAGTSIGAINASLIAKHCRQEDRGAATLERFWKDILANPSFPFCPIPGAFQPLHAVWTSVLFGNRHLLLPAFGTPSSHSLLSPSIVRNRWNKQSIIILEDMVQGRRSPA